MTRDIEILKSLFLPEIEELYPVAPDLKTSVQQEAFWSYINVILFDSKEIVSFLQSYKIGKSDYIISQFEQLRKEYVASLASEFCNGETNPTVELLLKSQYKPFIDEVTFQKELKQAVIITEREKLKKRLSLMDEATSFEITDSEITSAFQLLEKKNKYESLKKKMKEWDKTERPAYANNENIYFQLNEPKVNYIPSKKNSKIIPLSFTKYAVAACFIGAMAWIGIKFYNNQPKENILAKNNSDSLKAVQVKPEFAKVEMTQYVLPIVNETGLGFGKTAKIEKINIAIQDVTPRIVSIEAFLNTPKIDTSERTLRTNAAEELESLKKLSTSYIFDGVTLHLFRTIDAHVQNIIIKTSDKEYYFKAGDSFYYLININKQEEFKKVTDEVLIDKLERIVFDNEK